MIAATAWIASRTPAPPAPLARRLEEIVSGHTFADGTALSRFLVEQAGALLSRPCLERSAAEDLLVADSLITYAVEAASDDCESFGDSVEWIIGRLAMPNPDRS